MNPDKFDINTKPIKYIFTSGAFDNNAVHDKLLNGDTIFLKGYERDNVGDTYIGILPTNVTELKSEDLSSNDYDALPDYNYTFSADLIIYPSTEFGPIGESFINLSYIDLRACVKGTHNENAIN